MPDVLTYFDQGRNLLVTQKSLLTNGSVGGALSGTVSAFDDQFANLNAWTFLNGTPTVAANLVSMPAAAKMVAGHSEWWDWSAGTQIRFRWDTGASTAVYKYASATNQVYMYLVAETITLGKVINGSFSAVNNAAFAPVNGTFYWFQIVITGTTHTVEIRSDSGGAPGFLIATVTGTISDPEVTYGQLALGENNGTGTSAFGGAFADVCLVKIPAPANWGTTVNGGVPAYAVTKSNRVSGLYGVSIYHPYAEASNNFWTCLMAGSPNVALNDVLRASARMKQVGGGTSRLYVLSGTGGDIGGIDNGAVAFDWKTVTTSQVNTAAGTAVGVRFYSRGNGTSYMDNAWLSPNGSRFIPRGNFK